MNIFPLYSEHYIAKLEIRLQELKQDLETALRKKTAAEKRCEQAIKDFDIATRISTAVARQADCSRRIVESEKETNSAEFEVSIIQQQIASLLRKIQFNSNLVLTDESRLPSACHRTVMPTVAAAPTITEITMQQDLREIDGNSVTPCANTVQTKTLPTVKFYQTTTFKICIMAGLTVGLIAGTAILLATPAGLAFAAAAIMQLKLIALLLLKLTLSIITNHLLPAATRILLFCKLHPIISAAIVLGLIQAVCLISLVNKACVYICNKNLLTIFSDKLFPKKSNSDKLFPKKSKAAVLTKADFNLAVNTCGLDPELAKRAAKQKPGDADYDQALRQCFML